jgi:cation transport protein ChaC
MSEHDLIERRRLQPPPGEDFWIFGYGSLMWNPGFPYLESHPGLLHGYHRAFCVLSNHYRGTSERPGLVLGLDRGGACRGRAYRVAAHHHKEVIDYLHEREMITGVYEPRWLPVLLEPAAGSPMEVPAACRAIRSPPMIRAAAYVVDRAHAQYVGKLAPEKIAEIILQCHGTSGSNVAYLENTVRHLDELGIADGPLHRLLRLVEARRG